MRVFSDMNFFAHVKITFRLLLALPLEMAIQNWSLCEYKCFKRIKRGTPISVFEILGKFYSHNQNRAQVVCHVFVTDCDIYSHIHHSHHRLDQSPISNTQSACYTHPHFRNVAIERDHFSSREGGRRLLPSPAYPLLYSTVLDYTTLHYGVVQGQPDRVFFFYIEIGNIQFLFFVNNDI